MKKEVIEVFISKNLLRTKFAFLSMFFIFLGLCCVQYILNTIIQNIAVSSKEYFVFSIIIIYMSIVIHELVHSFVFICYHMKIRLFYIMPFCYIKIADVWHVKINFNHLGIMGASFPQLHGIDKEDILKKVKLAYSKSMLYATVSSFVIMILGALIMVIGYLFLKIESLYVVGCLIVLFNFLILIGAFSKSEYVYGDFWAYKLFSSKGDKSTYHIYKYIKVSLSQKELKRENNFMREEIIRCFEERTISCFATIDRIDIATMLLKDYLVLGNELPVSLFSFMQQIEKERDKIINSTEVYKKFMVMLAYYYEHTDNHISAEVIRDNYIMKLSNSAVDKYLKLQSEQIISNINNSYYLMKYKNIKPDSFYSFYKLFNGCYIEDELILNNKKLNIG